MIFKRISLILIVTSCVLVQVYGDDCDGDINLAMNRYSLVYSSNGSLRLEWGRENLTDCPLEFHLTVHDEDLNVTQSIHLNQNFTNLDELSPCVTYQMNLTAINKAVSDEEGPTSTFYLLMLARRQIAPTLESLDIKATSFNMTWRLEGERNRCPLSALYVTGQYFNTTVPLEELKNSETVSVEITSLRPNSMYYFQVSVENSAGTSQAFPLSVQTTEL